MYSDVLIHAKFVIWKDYMMVFKPRGELNQDSCARNMHSSLERGYQNLLEKTEESRENLLFLYKNSVPVSQGTVFPQYKDILILAVYGNIRRLFCGSYGTHNTLCDKMYKIYKKPSLESSETPVLIYKTHGA